MTSESAVGQRGDSAEEAKDRERRQATEERRNRSAQLAQPQAADARGRVPIPRALGAGSAKPRSVARLTLDRGRGRVLATRPPYFVAMECRGCSSPAGSR